MQVGKHTFSSISFRVRTYVHTYISTYIPTRPPIRPAKENCLIPCCRWVGRVYVRSKIVEIEARSPPNGHVFFGSSASALYPVRSIWKIWKTHLPILSAAIPFSPARHSRASILANLSSTVASLLIRDWGRKRPEKSEIETAGCPSYLISGRGLILILFFACFCFVFRGSNFFV